MTEKRLQYEIVLWFGQLYPELYGCLFEVNNNVKNIKQAQQRKSLGMVAGVSDLILNGLGVFCGIEIKALETRHSTEHIKRQIAWGELMIKNGGFYLMSQHINIIKIFITAILDKQLKTAKIIQNESLGFVKAQFENKTILF